MRTGIVALAVMVVMAVPATALAQTGRDVLARCLAATKVLQGRTSTRDEADAGMWCIGYVSGMVDGITTMTSHLPSKKICIPPNGLSSEESVKIVTDWLMANPGALAESGRSAVVIAIGTAFPCQAKR